MENQRENLDVIKPKRDILNIVGAIPISILFGYGTFHLILIVLNNVFEIREFSHNLALYSAIKWISVLMTFIYYFILFKINKLRLLVAIFLGYITCKLIYPFLGALAFFGFLGDSGVLIIFGFFTLGVLMVFIYYHLLGHVGSFKE